METSSEEAVKPVRRECEQLDPLGETPEEEERIREEDEAERVREFLYGSPEGTPGATEEKKDGEEETEDKKEEEEEGRESKSVTAPLRVSKQEREEHNKTHCPYRSWCDVCVKARGMNAPHKRKTEREKETEIPRISMDYFYMSKKDEEAKENPVLVIVNEMTNERYARATGKKGVGTEGLQDWLVRDVSEEMKAWGHAGGVGGRVILKTDGEGAMVAFRDAVARYHGGMVVTEEPAKGQSQSNGMVEGAGRIVREFTRVLKIQMEDKAGIKVGSDDAVLQWAIRWAAMMVSRFMVGTDGKTGYERRRGRKCTIPVIPFGEKIWYKEIRDGKDRKHKLETEEKEGIWLGQSRSSNEIIVGTREGVVRAYTVRRREEGQQWDGNLIKEMKGTPKAPDPSKEGFNIPTKVNFDADEDAPAEEKQTDKIDIRRMRITPDLLKKHGYTDGCEGCRFKRAGLEGSRPHTEVCRKRLAEAMDKDEDGRRKIEKEKVRLDNRMALEVEDADRRRPVEAPEAREDGQ